MLRIVVCLLVVVCFGHATKVKLVCKDKSSTCQDMVDQCDQDIYKLLCRKTCGFCKCEDLGISEVCESNDICSSNEGRLLCEKKCDACEFTIITSPFSSSFNFGKFKFGGISKTNNQNNSSSQSSSDKNGSSQNANNQTSGDSINQTSGGNSTSGDSNNQTSGGNSTSGDSNNQSSAGDSNNQTSSANKEEDNSSNKSSGLADECVKIHNQKRALHKDTPSLEWDDELAKSAEEWAKKISRDNSMSHSSAKDYGENLYMSSEKDMKNPCETATNKWYDEIKQFDFNNPEGNMGTGHFTQVVWKESTKLGCGVGKDKNLYVTCQYKKKGNFRGKYKKNVMRLA